jgi:hypothetical protein
MIAMLSLQDSMVLLVLLTFVVLMVFVVGRAGRKR